MYVGFAWLYLLVDWSVVVLGPFGSFGHIQSEFCHLNIYSIWVTEWCDELEVICFLTDINLCIVIEEIPWITTLESLYLRHYKTMRGDKQETRHRDRMPYPFGRVVAWDLLYAQSHRHGCAYHCLWWPSGGAPKDHKGQTLIASCIP